MVLTRYIQARRTIHVRNEPILTPGLNGDFRVRSERMDRRSLRFGASPSNDERGVADGNPFGKVRIVREQAVGVTDTKDGRYYSDTETRRGRPHALEMFKILGGDAIEYLELVVGEHHPVVSDLHRTAQQFQREIAILGDLQVAPKEEPSRRQGHFAPRRRQQTRTFCS